LPAVDLHEGIVGAGTKWDAAQLDNDGSARYDTPVNIDFAFSYAGHCPGWLRTRFSGFVEVE
jgi:hypothetical protein